jgi:hypothetical protein
VTTPTRIRLTTAQAIAYGALVVGTIDLVDAIVFYGLRNGVSPTRILQSIAAGLLGSASFSGGMTTAVLGLGLHYFIAASVVAVYVVASRWMPGLGLESFVSGALYGLQVYLVMNDLVIPLSRAAHGPKPLIVLANGIAIHMLGVGIPAAWFARAANGSAAFPLTRLAVKLRRETLS